MQYVKRFLDAYGKSDKIERGIADNSIDGVVLSPKAETPDRLETYITEKQTEGVQIYFDPQFYLVSADWLLNA